VRASQTHQALTLILVPLLMSCNTPSGAFSPPPTVTTATSAAISTREPTRQVMAPLPPTPLGATPLPTRGISPTSIPLEGDVDMTGLVATSLPGTSLGLGARIHSRVDGGRDGRRRQELYRIPLEAGQNVEVLLDCSGSCIGRLFYPQTAVERPPTFFTEVAPPRRGHPDHH